MANILSFHVDMNCYETRYKSILVVAGISDRSMMICHIQKMLFVVKQTFPNIFSIHVQ